MKNTVLKSILLGAGFFLSACDYYVPQGNISAPQETAPRSVGRIILPPVLRGIDVSGIGVSVDGNGTLDVALTSICDAAKIVVADTLRASYSCSGDGRIALSHSSRDPVSLLALFVATVEKAGGSAVSRGGALVVTGVPEGQAGGFEGSGSFAFDAPNAVEGLDAFVFDDPDDMATIRDVATFSRRGLALSVPARFGAAELEDAFDVLGYDMQVLNVGAARFVVGDEQQLSVLTAFLDNAMDIVVSVPSAFVSPVAVGAFAASFPTVRFDLDTDASTLFVGGYPADVAAALKELDGSFPSVSRLEIKGLFFSYSVSEFAGLEADLSILSQPYTFGRSDIGVGLSSTGVIAAPFSLLVDHVEGLSNASIVAKPSVTASFGKPAIFRSGVEVPIQVSVDPETGTKVFEYRQTGLTLEFVAVPVGVHLIRLDISANMSTVDDTTTENPRFDTRSVSTTVDLRRGDTVLLSGLDELEISSSQSSDFGLPSSSRSKVNRSVGLFVTIE